MTKRYVTSIEENINGKKKGISEYSYEEITAITKTVHEVMGLDFTRISSTTCLSGVCCETGRASCSHPGRKLGRSILDGTVVTSTKLQGYVTKHQLKHKH